MLGEALKGVKRPCFTHWPLAGELPNRVDNDKVIRGVPVSVCTLAGGRSIGIQTAISHNVLLVESPKSLH